MGVGRWLIVCDPLQRSTAIAVMGGELPYRAMEAAAIYRQGWAPEVWVSHDDLDADVDSAMRRLGRPSGIR